MAEQSRVWEQLRPTSLDPSFGGAVLQAGSAFHHDLAASAMTAYYEGVRRSSALAEVWAVSARRPAIGALFLGPTEGFGRYVLAALERVRAGEDGEPCAAGNAGLLLAESQVAASTELYEALAPQESTGEGVSAGRGHAGIGTGRRSEVATRADPADARDADGHASTLVHVPERVERFLLVQEADVRAHASSLVAPDGRPIGDVVVTARRSGGQRAFGRLLTACNREALMHRPGTLQPFPLTDTVARFFVDLGFFDGASRRDVAELVDGLYFTLYEATDKKRRLRAYLPDAACAVVDRVKRLRNCLFRHNWEIERPEDLAKQAAQVLADLRALGLDGEPHTPAECGLLHDRLLADATALLEAVRDVIRGRHA